MPFFLSSYLTTEGGGHRSLFSQLTLFFVLLTFWPFHFASFPFLTKIFSGAFILKTNQPNNSCYWMSLQRWQNSSRTGLYKHLQTYQPPNQKRQLQILQTFLLSFIFFLLFPPISPAFEERSGCLGQAAKSAFAVQHHRLSKALVQHLGCSCHITSNSTTKA